MMYTLFTVGHSNHPPERLLELLSQHQIKILVDVRSAPYSRYVPHFNKREIQHWLPEGGVEYRYAGEYLGGRPQDESVYKGDVPDDGELRREEYLKQVDYLKLMQTPHYQKGLFHLLALVTESGLKVALMCAEADPRHCHRHHLITRSLIDPANRVTDMDVEVAHILSNGELDHVDPQEFNIPTQLGLFD